jgi:hypothetical protein
VISLGRGTESPEHYGAGGNFDNGIEAEADECDAACNDSGDDGYEGFEGIPQDGEVLESASATHDGGTRDDGGGHISLSLVGDVASVKRRR